MALYICTHTFQGELEGGLTLSAEKDVTVLDSSKADEAKMLKAWAIYFTPVESPARPAEEKPAEEKPAKANAKSFGLSTADLKRPS